MLRSVLEFKELKNVPQYLNECNFKFYVLADVLMINRKYLDAMMFVQSNQKYIKTLFA